ncbi:MAG: sulfite exporter TauE/SafE family protein [Candidatus Lokiarchaeota archaeon]|nr:sulfite exporter TauE/SafE family protein [Candidatus Lokiarchaeota archaeon]
MEITAYTLLICATLSILVGAFAALSGTGGGSFNVPIFTFLLFIDDRNVAIGTSLFVVLINSISTNLAYRRQKRIDYKIGGILLLFSAPMSIIGTLLKRAIAVDLASGKDIMDFCFYGFIMFIGLYILFQKAGAGAGEGEVTARACDGRLAFQRSIIDCDGKCFEYPVRITWLVAALAMAAGFLAGFLGIGGGLVQVPMLNLLCGVPLHVTVATSGFMILANSLVGSITNFAISGVDVVLGVIYGAGSVVGAQIGARVAKGTTNKALKKIISGCMIGIGAYQYLRLLVGF